MLRFVATNSARLAVPSRPRLAGATSRAAIAASGASAVLLYRYSHGSARGQSNNRRPDIPALAEAPASNDDDENKPKAAAAPGWVDNVKKDGLAKFLNDFILADDEEENKVNQNEGERSKPPTPAPKSEGGNIFDKIRDELKDAVEDIADKLPKPGGTEPSAAEETRDQQKVSINTGNEGFASLTKSIVSLISGDDTSNEQVVRTIIDTARKNVDAGEVNEQKSYDELLVIFRDLATTLNNTFGELELNEFDPTSLFYYLEYEDERKNPSWKRMMHRYQRGVDVRMVNDLFDALQFAHLAYACTEKDVREGLDSFEDKYELVLYEPDSEPGKPSHYLALKKGQSRWSNELEVILAVRGTQSLTDVITDCLMTPTDYRDGKAHDGMVRSGQYLAEKNRKLLLKLLQTSGKKRIKLKLYGHSLGASAATIAGIELNDEDGIDASVVGFGCPAMLSRTLSEKYKDMVLTVVNDADMIPRMSGSTLFNIALDVMEYDWTPKARRDTEQALRELQSNASILIGESDVSTAMGFVDKVIAKYIQPGIVKDDVPSPKRVEPVLFPPGTLVHFYRDGSSVSGRYAPCTFFSEIDISRTMIEDHLIKSGYHRLFLTLMRDYHGDEHFAFESAKEFDF